MDHGGDVMCSVIDCMRACVICISAMLTESDGNALGSGDIDGT